MTLRRGESPVAPVQARHKVTVTFPSIKETVLGTPPTLPTTAPAAGAGYQMTALSSDMPIFSGGKFNVYSTIGHMCLGVTNNGASSASISYKVLINGTQQISTTTVATAGADLVISAFYPCNVNDVFEMSAWTTAASCVAKGYSFQTLLNMIYLEGALQLVYDFQMTVQQVPAIPMSYFTSSGSNTASLTFRTGLTLPTGESNLSASITSTTGTTACRVFREPASTSTYTLRTTPGETTNTFTSTTPSVQRPVQPATVSWSALYL